MYINALLNYDIFKVILWYSCHDFMKQCVPCVHLLFILSILQAYNINFYSDMI